ncbi:MAG: phage integrase SAM-like domain-containing protein [Opitutales bacterium]|nr:phage integrase SAM-like domain-containing protein [Opitutales bacterium]
MIDPTEIRIASMRGGDLPSFRDWDGRSAKKPYGWDWLMPQPDGRSKRMRKGFATKREKQDFFKAFRDQWRLNMSAMISFDPDLYRQALEARDILGKVSIIEAANYYATERPDRNSMSFGELCEEFLARTERRKNKGLTHMTKHLERAKMFIEPSMQIAQIQRSDCQMFIDYLMESPNSRTGEPVGSVTIHNHAATLTGCFNYAIKYHEALIKNPASHLELPPRKMKPPITMDAADVERLFRANEHKDPSFCGLMALCFFGGIRVSMLYLDKGEAATGAMDGSEIKFDTKRLIFRAEQMKQGKEHLAEGLPDNLWGWCKLIDPNDWGMTRRQFYVRRERFEKRAKIKIPHNSPRKSFGTYYSTLEGDNRRASQIMSDSTDSIFLKHYKADNRSRDEAKRFFGIIRHVDSHNDYPRVSSGAS